MKNLFIVLTAMFMSLASLDNASAQAPMIADFGGVVYVGGTPERDNVLISYSHGLITIKLITSTTSLSKSFRLGYLHSIVCDLGQGDDQFRNRTSVPESVFFDSGANFAECGSGDSTVHGGTGIDWIFGGAGDDHLQGGAGTDLIFGGEGVDKLYHFYPPSYGRFPEDNDVDVIYGTFWVDEIIIGNGDYFYPR